MSQIASRPDTSTDEDIRTRRRIDMPWWEWLLLVVGVVATLGFTVVYWWFIEFGYAGCGEPDIDKMHAGQHLLAELWGGVSLTWLALAWLSRFRVPVVVGGLLCSAVAAAFFWHGLSPSAWTDGFCF